MMGFDPVEEIREILKENGNNTDYIRLDNKYRELIYCSNDVDKVIKMKDRINKV